MSCVCVCVSYSAVLLLQTLISFMAKYGHQVLFHANSIITIRSFVHSFVCFLVRFICKTSDWWVGCLIFFKLFTQICNNDTTNSNNISWSISTATTLTDNRPANRQPWRRLSSTQRKALTQTLPACYERTTVTLNMNPLGPSIQQTVRPRWELEEGRTTTSLGNSIKWFPLQWRLGVWRTPASFTAVRKQWTSARLLGWLAGMETDRQTDQHIKSTPRRTKTKQKT